MAKLLRLGGCLIMIGNPKLQTSKILLKFDYLIAIALLIVFGICIIVNVVYEYNITQILIAQGTPEYVSSIVSPIDLSQLVVIVTAWITQLGVSSGAYYFMAKSDHSIEIPARMINDLPEDLQCQVDPTQVIVAAITTKN